MSKIAVIMPKWIGDYIMSLSVVEKFRKETGDDVSLITAPYLVDLASSLTDMDIITYKTEEGLLTLQEGGYSALYIIPHSISTALWGYATNIKSRIGYKKEGRSPLLTKRLKRINIDRVAHITTEYSNLFGIGDLDLASVKGIENNLKKSNKVVLCPGAKYGPAKQWPHFSYLMESLPDEEFIILGSKDEFAYAEQLKCENPDISVENRCGTGTLNDAADILAASKVVISNDSGLMHLGAYMNANVVGIFGSSTPDWTQPVGTSSKVMHRGESCSPCFKRECPYGHYHCLDKITVTEILSEITPYLKG